MRKNLASMCLNVLLVNTVDFMVVYHGFFLVLENLFLDLSLKRGMSFEFC